MKTRSLLSELKFKRDDDISVNPLMTSTMIRKKGPKPFSQERKLYQKVKFLESDL